jgi:lipopolysaccharide assembly outer membrane protein LptD (OstA)
VGDFQVAIGGGFWVAIRGKGLFENVKATFGDFVITSDKAKYDEKASKVLFRGNVKAINNNGRLSCSSVEFNLNTQSILCQ